MKRLLNGADAFMLGMETSKAYMHTFKVAIIDPSTDPNGWSFDRFYDEVSRQYMCCQCCGGSISTVASRIRSKSPCGGSGFGERSHSVALPDSVVAAAAPGVSDGRAWVRVAGGD